MSMYVFIGVNIFFFFFVDWKVLGINVSYANKISKFTFRNLFVLIVKNVSILSPCENSSTILRAQSYNTLPTGPTTRRNIFFCTSVICLIVKAGLYLAFCYLLNIIFFFFAHLKFGGTVLLTILNKRKIKVTHIF